MVKVVCNVAIIGCGLGGVAASIAIRRAGHTVTIYESAPALAEIGAGIQLPRNCTRILKRWNVLQAMELISIRPSNVLLRSFKDGSILLQRTFPSKSDTPHLLSHRADFLAVLAEEAVKLGVSIRFGTVVSEFDFEHSSVKLPDGQGIHYDVILGADGQKSFCREAMLGRSDPPKLSGEVAYRVVIPIEMLEKYEELSKYVASLDISCWMGPNAHLVSYQLKRALNLVLIGPDSDTLTRTKNTKSERQEVEELLKSWDSRLRTLFSLSQDVLKRRLMSSHEMTTWSHPNGAFALVGDACHVSTPHLAQGAAQAIEDGATLGELFARIECKQQIKDILHMYEAIRKPRTTIVIARSNARREIYQLSDGVAQHERDRQLLQASSDSNYPEFMGSEAFEKWLFEYDVEVEVEKAWHQYSKQA